MAKRGPVPNAAPSGADKATNSIDSNGPINKFFQGRKDDWNIAKNIGKTYQDSGKNLGKTADSFLKEFGGGSSGRGAAKLGGYAVGGAMLYDMLFD